MRNYLFLALFTAVTLTSYGQGVRFGVVDSEYVLKQIPEYTQAQNQLNQMSKQWQGEVEALLSETDALQKALDSERILLTDEMVSEREKMIKEKAEQARKLQRQYFGPTGDLFKKRQELIKPIQDQVYNAVQEVARKKRLDAVFDKGSALTILHNSKKADISEDVLEALGY